MRLRNGSMTALAVAGLLAGCNKAPDNAAAQTGNATAADSNAALPALPQALPMETGAATSLGLAPPASALRARTPVQIAGLASSSDSYAYLDRAAGQSDAYGDAPPDYAFDYDGVSPWVWQAGDGSTEYAEPVDGGYRSYYYQPGADEPYLVRDGDYSYAYAGAALVAIYLGGRLLTRQQWGDHARYAAGYRDRAENLYHASRDNRRGVIAANWAARRDQIAQQRGAWAAERAQQADWAAYHRDHAAQEQDHWAQDRQQRAVAAQRFDAWRQQDYRGQAPYARPGPGPAPQDRAQDRQPDRQPDNRQPPHPQPATQPTPDRRPDARPDARPDGRDTRPTAAERPAAAAAPAAIDRPVAPAGHGRAPMLGSDTAHMRERDVHPLDAPHHEPEHAAPARFEHSRAEPPRAEPPRAEQHHAEQPRAEEPPVEVHRGQPAPKPGGERAPPHVEAPHVEAPRPAPHVEAPHEHPREAPHPAPPRGSEPHGDDRHR